MDSFKNSSQVDEDNLDVHTNNHVFSLMTPNMGIVVNEISLQESKLSYTLRTRPFIDTASLFPDSVQPGPGTQYSKYNIFCMYKYLSIVYKDNRQAV